MAKEADLRVLQNQLQNYLQRNDLSRFVDARTITEWLIQEEDDPVTMVSASNLLSGLLPSKVLERKQNIQDLLDLLLKISRIVNDEKFEKAVLSKDKVSLVLTEQKIPPMDWADPYKDAFALIRKQSFYEATTLYNKTFESLLREETTDREPFRIYLNASIGYMFGGFPKLGRACLDYSLKLNPNYPLARNTLQDLEDHSLDDTKDMDKVYRMAHAPLVFFRKSDRMLARETPSKHLVIGLKSVGINIKKDWLLLKAKQFNSVKDLAEQEVLKGSETNKELVFLSLYSLWYKWCPEEPCHEILDDILLKFQVSVLHQDNDKISSDMIKLDKLLFVEKSDFLRSWSLTKAYSDKKGILMAILMAMYSDKEMRPIGLRMGKRLKTKTKDPVWSIPCAFMDEKNTDQLMKAVMKRNDEMEKFFFNQFLNAKQLLSGETQQASLGNQSNLENFTSADEMDPKKEVESIMTKFIENEISEKEGEVLFHPASVYFRYLKGLNLNFKTEEDVESESRQIVIGPKRTVKIGRNEPCPCGSGKKYKKCCGRSK